MVPALAGLQGGKNVRPVGRWGYEPPPVLPCVWVFPASVRSQVASTKGPPVAPVARLEAENLQTTSSFGVAGSTLG